MQSEGEAGAKRRGERGGGLKIASDLERYERALKLDTKLAIARSLKHAHDGKRSVERACIVGGQDFRTRSKPNCVLNPAVGTGCQNGGHILYMQKNDEKRRASH